MLNIPKLRFKKFSDDYVEYRLSELMIRYSKNNKDEEFSINDILSLSSEYGVVDRKELLEDTYSKVNHKNYIKTKLNDFVYGKSISANYPYGLFKVNKCRDGLLSTLYFTFKTFENVSSSYLDSYFSHHNRANNFLKKYVLVGDRYINADSDYILSGKIFIPLQHEQEQIVSFLSSINRKIEQLTQKKTLLESYKKGVNQKIFSQKLRFKRDDGGEFEDWDYKNGNLVFETISNKNHNSDLPILAISQKYGAIPRELIDYKVHVSTKSVDSYKVVEVGDFIISLRSFQGGIEYSNYLGICSPAYIILRPKIELDRGFFRFYLKTYSYIQELKKKLEGIRDGKMISYKYFSEIKLPLPCLAEQQKISTFLTSLDQKIIQTTQQIEAMKSFKKGLLQGMFV